MAFSSFISRMRNGSQAVNNKENEPSSSSSTSLLEDDELRIPHSNTISQLPQAKGVETVEPMARGARMDETYQERPESRSMTETEREQPLTLRKRFFSRSGAPKTSTGRPMTSGNSDTIPENEELVQSPNNDVGMVMFMKAIEESFSKHFEEARFEPVRQVARTFSVQKEQYQWQNPGSTNPSYPPCLAVVPKECRTGLLHIFETRRLMNTVIAMLPEIPPGIEAFLFGETVGKTIAQVEARMKDLTKQGKSIGSMPSIANRDDWYTDAVFAQQAFTGSNPTVITKATDEWMKRFMSAANAQGNKGMYTLLNTANSATMYMQDNSYFRSAINVPLNSTLSSEDGRRFGCASVTLMQLDGNGRLHPLAIVLDYRGNMENSVCIFNKRLNPEASKQHEASDWPWRYAKLCHQTSSWMRDECATHLNDCHFVVEATIVAAQRSFPTDHIVYNLLAPHWDRTLSLNAAARETLIPNYITQINGMTAAQTHSFILDAYTRFNFPANYVPTALSRRGFPPAALNTPRFKNYVWANNVTLLWSRLHKFVRKMLLTVYSTNEDVSNDAAVQSWCLEMYSPTGAQMPSFPDIQTIEDLTNAIVMCIHLSTAMHNSVNYLQCYYMSFLPNKPSCLMSPLPSKLSELMRYGEKDFMAALPIKDMRVWRMCEQLPFLLNSSVNEDKAMLAYCRKLESEAAAKKGAKWEMVSEAARELFDDLMVLEKMFDDNNKNMDDQTMPYTVLHPKELAVSAMI